MSEQHDPVGLMRKLRDIPVDVVDGKLEAAAKKVVKDHVSEQADPKAAAAALDPIVDGWLESRRMQNRHRKQGS